MMPGYGKKVPTPASPEKGKSSKKKLKTINKAHPQFELAYDMMLGIRTSVGLLEKTPIKNQIEPTDYTTEVRYRFPHDGSHSTPAHQMRDFKFKDYCPEAFRKLRQRYGIFPQDYLMCLCGDFSFIEFISNSKSGSFFFYSYDRRYMIKTISQAEKDFLVKIMPNYSLHLFNNPSSLINRFYGLHRVKPHKKEQVHFLIMGSVFFTRRTMHQTFDLKGSSQGREASEKAKKKGDCVFKDNDFVEKGIIICVGPERAKRLSDQIATDASFLQSLNIMDYSLLLGIHDCTHRTLKREESFSMMGATTSAAYKPDGSINRSTQKEDDFELHPPGREEKELSEMRGQSLQDAPHTERRQTVHALPNKYSLFASPASSKFVADPLAVVLSTDPPKEEEKKITLVPQPSTVMSEFHNDDGGMRGEEDGQFNNKIYYMGIIDILIEYGVSKKAESRLKSLKYKLSTLSACPPDMYAKRFKEFLTARIK